MPPRPGRVTTSTPAKPTPIALQRRQPIRSPSIGPDSTATRNGVENRIDSASSSWRNFRAKKLSMVEPSSRAERPTCKSGRRVVITPGRVSGLDRISASRNALV